MYSGLLQGFRLHKPLFYIRLQAYVNICLHPIKTFFFPKWSISLECMPPYGRKDLLALLLLHHDFNIIQYPMWPKWCHQKRKVVSGEEQVTTFWWNMKPNFFFLWNMMNRSQWDRKHAIKKKMGFVLTSRTLSGKINAASHLHRWVARSNDSLFRSYSSAIIIILFCINRPLQPFILPRNNGPIYSASCLSHITGQ